MAGRRLASWETQLAQYASVLTRAWMAACALASINCASTAHAQALLDAAGYERLSTAYTTTVYSVDELRSIGQAELKRIHGEIRSIIEEVAFPGTVEAFLEHLRTSDDFYYPDTEAGRQAYLADAAQIVAEVEGRLHEIITPPLGLARIEIVAMNIDTVAAAMYEPPASEGVAGRLHFNVADMRSAPRFHLPAIAYHEGLPGHHLQATVARQRSQANNEPLRQIAAFSEGWAHYAERLPWDIGLYHDPYAHAGRLNLEAWRAARLVADVGLAVDGWSRSDAIAFMLKNTALSERQAALEVERMAAQPASTNVYIVGKLEIMGLRARAEAALGARFDQTAFHQEVLRDGAIPLPELEENVDEWIARSVRH